MCNYKAIEYYLAAFLGPSYDESNKNGIPGLVWVPKKEDYMLSEWIHESQSEVL